VFKSNSSPPLRKALSLAAGPRSLLQTTFALKGSPKRGTAVTSAQSGGKDGRQGLPESLLREVEDRGGQPVARPVRGPRQ
jgi:hypothetical protein